MLAGADRGVSAARTPMAKARNTAGAICDLACAAVFTVANAPVAPKPIPSSGSLGLHSRGAHRYALGVGDITLILKKMERGEEGASSQLLKIVYDDLRRVAAGKMARETPGQTLQPTALVHEAWQRLGGEAQPHWQNRAHFFGAAAEAMRRILVDNARRKNRLRHGGEFRRVDWSKFDVAAVEDDDAVLQLHEALVRLARHDPEGARLIELRFFGGLSNAEAAAVMGLPERTAKRTWAYARAWLHKDLKGKVA